jgi:asparagine synthetase B (glutamine-hydrolysing)
MIDQYLRYGCSNEFPQTNLPKVTDLDYDEIISTFNDLIDNSMPDINDAVLQLSGGFDSSIVASYYNNIKSFCTGPEDSPDRIYSEKVSKEFDTRHTWMSHKELLSRIDFKETIVEMAKINRYPRCFKNDFGLFAFLKYIKEYTNDVISGKGIEFQLLGYHTIYNGIIERSIGTREYSIDRANQYLNQKSVDSPKDAALFDIRNIISSSKNKEDYSLDLVNFWTGVFSRREVEKLTGNKQSDPTFSTVREAIDFIFEWFGREYVDKRLEDYGNYFGVNCITPYINEDVIKFVKTIPIELKKCLNHHKYIFYQAMGHRLPNYIIERSKEGLNTSLDYFNSHMEDIHILVEEYLTDKTMKIHNYIDFNQADLDFDQLWSLLNLSIWIEHNGSN